MKIIRPIQLTDLASFFKLACSQSLGIRSLPKDIDLLKKQVQNSLKCFKNILPKKSSSEFIFVLEDLETKELLGTSQIITKAGTKNPLYVFAREEEKLPNRRKIPLLKIKKITHAPTEIRGLFLSYNTRKEGLGKLLSFSRFHFMKFFPKVFSTHTMAEMRGFIDAEGKSPFWSHVGSHFAPFSLNDALENDIHDKLFIKTFLPKHPLYIPLLPEEAIEVLGKTHPHTEAALHLLEEIGFKKTGSIDIIEAGPNLEAVTKEIHVIKESQIAKTISFTTEDLSKEKSFLLSTNSPQFRSCISKGILHKNQLILPIDTADGLKIHSHSLVALYPL